MKNTTEYKVMTLSSSIIPHEEYNRIESDVSLSSSTIPHEEYHRIESDDFIEFYYTT